MAYAPGKLEAVTYDANGTEQSRCAIETAGEPHHLRLTTIENPEGFKADGADMAIVEVEVVDKQGRRCPLDDRMVHFTLTGEGQWLGGIATRHNKDFQIAEENRDKSLLDAANVKNISDNFVRAVSLPVECGVNRVLVRSTVNAGDITLYASAEGMGTPVRVKLHTEPVTDNLLPSLTLEGRLSRGETLSDPSYHDRAATVRILSAEAGYDAEHATNSFDDNELSEWKNDGRLSTAWVTYHLERKAFIDDICLKLTGWRLRSYPLEIFAGKRLIWSGETNRSLGYVHITPSVRVKTDQITIRLKGAGKDKDAFGGITEVAEPAAGELDLFKAKNGGETHHELRIVETDFLENVFSE